MGLVQQYDKIIFLTYKQHMKNIIKILRSRIEDDLDNTKYTILHSDILYEVEPNMEIFKNQNNCTKQIDIDSEVLVDMLREEMKFWQENDLLNIHVEEDEDFFNFLDFSDKFSQEQNLEDNLIDTNAHIGYQNSRHKQVDQLHQDKHKQTKETTKIKEKLKNQDKKIDLKQDRSKGLLNPEFIKKTLENSRFDIENISNLNMNSQIQDLDNKNQIMNIRKKTLSYSASNKYKTQKSDDGFVIRDFDHREQDQKKQPFSSKFLETMLPFPNDEEVVLVSVGVKQLSRDLEFRLRKYGFKNIVVIN